MAYLILMYFENTLSKFSVNFDLGVFEDFFGFFLRARVIRQEFEIENVDGAHDLFEVVEGHAACVFDDVLIERVPPCSDSPTRQEFYHLT